VFLLRRERSQSSTGRPWQMEVAGWISWGFDADRTGATPTTVFQEEELKILTQDRTILESARPCVDEGRDFEQSVMSDFPQLLARRLYQAALNGKEFDFDRRRIFQMRG
jgi:hypothetical protein